MSQQSKSTLLIYLIESDVQRVFFQWERIPDAGISRLCGMG